MTLYIVMCGCPEAYQMSVSSIHSSMEKATEASKTAFEFQWIDVMELDAEPIG